MRFEKVAAALRAVLVASLVALTTMSSQARAASKEIEFSDKHHTCDYSVRFDPAKIDETRLRATIDLLYRVQPISLGEPQFHEPKDVAKVDLGAYKSWCDAETARLRGVPVLDLPGIDIDAVRRELVAQLVDRCHLITAKIEAARGDVSALQGYAPAAATCTGFADSLARDDAAFLQAWDKWIKDRCAAAPEPADCLEQEHKVEAKPDVVPRKRLEMLVYGWYNCANGVSLMNQDPDLTRGGGSRLWRKVLTRFEKRMKVVETFCDTQD